MQNEWSRTRTFLASSSFVLVVEDLRTGPGPDRLLVGLGFSSDSIPSLLLNCTNSGFYGQVDECIGKGFLGYQPGPKPREPREFPTD